MAGKIGDWSISVPSSSIVTPYLVHMRRPFARASRWIQSTLRTTDLKRMGLELTWLRQTVRCESLTHSGGRLGEDLSPLISSIHLIRSAAKVSCVSLAVIHQSSLPRSGPPSMTLRSPGTDRYHITGFNYLAKL